MRFWKSSIFLRLCFQKFVLTLKSMEKQLLSISTVEKCLSLVWRVTNKRLFLDSWPLNLVWLKILTVLDLSSSWIPVKRCSYLKITCWLPLDMESMVKSTTLWKDLSLSLEVPFNGFVMVYAWWKAHLNLNNMHVILTTTMKFMWYRPSQV